MHRNTLIIAAALAFNLSAGAPFANASPEDRARAYAQEGPAALRHFVVRTRMIYALNIADYSPVQEDNNSYVTVQDDAAAPSATQAPGETARPSAQETEQARRDKELAEFREQIYRDMLHE
jgi:LmbE family N-acetylglucosaminyl deacetylase